MKNFFHVAQAVILDVDGTLFTLKESLGRSYSDVLAGLGVGANERALDMSCRTTWRAFQDQYLNVAGNFSTSHEREEAVWKEFVRRVLAGASVTCSVELRERAISDIYNFFSRGVTRRVAAGAEQFLSLMKQRGIPIIAATNNDRRTVQVVRELGLSSHFEYLFVSGDLAWKKPSPNFFLEISKRIGVPTAGLLHIGNNRELDVLAARKAGLHAIQFGIDASGEEDFAVRDFAELIQVLLGGRSQ
jgi:putative hydrolase of the HAD superfamily